MDQLDRKLVLTIVVANSTVGAAVRVHPARRIARLFRWIGGLANWGWSGCQLIMTVRLATIIYMLHDVYWGGIGARLIWPLATIVHGNVWRVQCAVGIGPGAVMVVAIFDQQFVVSISCRCHYDAISGNDVLVFQRAQILQTKIT